MQRYEQADPAGGHAGAAGGGDGEREETEMSSNAYAEILTYDPVDSGGFEHRDPSGSTWCSSDGMDLMVVEARLMEHWWDHLQAVTEIISHCPDHGLSFDGDDENHGVRWGVNDCFCDPLRDPAHVDFLLSGWHEAADDYCIAAWAHSVPAGLVVEIEKAEAEEEQQAVVEEGRE